MVTRWVLGIASAIVFLQFALIYGGVLSRLVFDRRLWDRAIAGSGIGAILLLTAMNQYKAAHVGLPVDWVTYLFVVAVLACLVGQTITLVRFLRHKRFDEG